jgi:phage FluMu gp28-like protein
MLPLTPRLRFLVEFLDLPAASGMPDAIWEAFQLEHLNNDSQFAIDTKARQIAWSFTAAAEAVAEARLTPRSTQIFVSINHDEAGEKIRYAKQIIESLARKAKPRLIIDNVFELEFENGSRLISHPCRPVRGKAKATVYLDEFAHYARDREIYISALPVTTKGGRIRIGSTPLGASGMFWEIYDQKIRPYPGYKRRSIPWWFVNALCVNVNEAKKTAAFMTTEERVGLFGNDRLKAIYDNMPLEDFQQEYECAWVDESVSWITWDEIKRNQVDAQEGRLWQRMARTVDEALRAIDETAQAVRAGTIESALAGGMDVGRKHDLTEITFVGKSQTADTPYRLGISLSKVSFEDQKAVALKALDTLPITQFLIDQNGLGMQLAEQIHEVHGGRAQGVDFTAGSKELWAVEMRVRMQKAQVPIPMDRDLAYQIHSIKKMVTAAKNVVFDTAANEKHHADKFWALALAVWAANRAGMIEMEAGENPLGDYRG